ncbi:MAG TPA: hypothetical protein PLU17_08695 [Chitinophagaceae bacterium]|nr:hypothetical protein [Chitinophagaceae bacterium]
MKKILLFFSLNALLILNLDAKDKEKKIDWYIKGFSWGVLGDFGTGKPYTQYNDSYNNLDTTFQGIRKPFGISFIYLGFNNHVILKEFSTEKSLSLNFAPTFGIGATRSRFLNISMPLMLCYNSGNISTYNSKRDFGITVGLGAEFIKAGLVKLTDEDEDIFDYSGGLVGYDKRIHNIIQPCMNLGLRYFTKGSHAQEINFKFGMRSDKVYDIYDKAPLGNNNTSLNFWARIMMVHYIRY